MSKLSFIVRTNTQGDPIRWETILSWDGKVKKEEVITGHFEAGGPYSNLIGALLGIREGLKKLLRPTKLYIQVTDPTVAELINSGLIYKHQVNKFCLKNGNRIIGAVLWEEILNRFQEHGQVSVRCIRK